MTAATTPTSTKLFTFACSPVFTGRYFPIGFTQKEIQATPALVGASIEDALLYGGELTRAAIGAMNLRGDKNYITVDTKTHMLMPGFSPAIPGWHTDGVPRNKNMNPQGSGRPDLWRQDMHEGDGPRYHLGVTGKHSQTEFLVQPVELELPILPVRDLYARVTKEIEQRPDVLRAQPFEHEIVEFGWWDIHRAVPATGFGWRFLIRVTESDWLPPKTDLREIVRTQQQVYVPTEFGW